MHSQSTASACMSAVHTLLTLIPPLPIPPGSCAAMPEAEPSIAGATYISSGGFSHCVMPVILLK